MLFALNVFESSAYVQSEREIFQYNNNLIMMTEMRLDYLVNGNQRHIEMSENENEYI